jgi:predicted ATPase
LLAADFGGRQVSIEFKGSHFKRDVILNPTTRELLDLLVAEAIRLRMLLIVTHRPEFDARAWSGLAHVTELHLARLGRCSNAALIRQVAGGKPLLPAIVEEIITRTDGVPLFAEELTKAVLEVGVPQEMDDGSMLTGATPAIAVPATLHASLLARLDRVATVRGVAQAGAVIGREFGCDLLATVNETLDSLLRALVQIAGRRTLPAH